MANKSKQRKTPKVLHEGNYAVPVKADSKQALGGEWNEKNFDFDNKRVLAHIAKGGNVGCIPKEGYLIADLESDEKIRQSIEEQDIEVDPDDIISIKDDIVKGHLKSNGIVVRSAGKGYHLYCKVPNGTDIGNSNSKIVINGVTVGDFIKPGLRQALCPPSTVKGKKYKMVSGKDAEYIQLPHDLSDALVGSGSTLKSFRKPHDETLHEYNTRNNLPYSIPSASTLPRSEKVGGTKPKATTKAGELDEKLSNDGIVFSETKPIPTNLRWDTLFALFSRWRFGWGTYFRGDVPENIYQNDPYIPPSFKDRSNWASEFPRIEEWRELCEAAIAKYTNDSFYEKYGDTYKDGLIDYSLQYSKAGFANYTDADVLKYIYKIQVVVGSSLGQNQYFVPRRDGFGYKRISREQAEMMTIRAACYDHDKIKPEDPTKPGNWPDKCKKGIVGYNKLLKDLPKKVAYQQSSETLYDTKGTKVIHLPSGEVVSARLWNNGFVGYDKEKHDYEFIPGSHDYFTTQSPIACDFTKPRKLADDHPFIQDMAKRAGTDDKDVLLWRGYLLGMLVLGVGYIDQRMVTFSGDSGTGKSTYIKLIGELLGEGTVAAVSSLAQLGDSHSLSNIKDVTVLALSDVADIEKSDRDVARGVEKLKQISVGDSIGINPKYQEPYTAKLPISIVIATNHMLGFARGVEDSKAWSRRNYEMPFMEKDYKSEISDYHLVLLGDNDTRNEIMSHLLYCYRKVEKAIAKKGQSAIEPEEYQLIRKEREDQALDPLDEWISCLRIFEPDSYADTPTISDLVNEYSTWLSLNGFKNQEITPRRLAQRLRKNRYTKVAEVSSGKSSKWKLYYDMKAEAKSSLNGKFDEKGVK